MNIKLFIPLFLLIIISCSPKNIIQDERIDAACPPDMICTMIFKSITLTVKDKESKPVLLDGYYSYFLKNGDTLLTMKSTENHGAGEGRYPVADDGSMKKVGKEGSEVVFKGIKNGLVVVEHKMVIGHDCCHITKLSGSDEAIVN